MNDLICISATISYRLGRTGTPKRTRAHDGLSGGEPDTAADQARGLQQRWTHHIVVGTHLSTRRKHNTGGWWLVT